MDELDELDEVKERHGPEEAQGPKGPQEDDDTDEVDELGEVNELQSEQWKRLDEAICNSEVHRSKDVNYPLFMLAHEVRGLEEELEVRFSIDITAEIVRRWSEQNHCYLDSDHDYHTEFLDKLSLVRFPKGRVLLRAVELAKKRLPPKQTRHSRPDVQLLACLCRVLQEQACNKPFFLDGRSAARGLGKPHESVASWLRALCRMRVIKLVSRGHIGTASRYLYIASSRTISRDSECTETFSVLSNQTLECKTTG